MSLKCFLKRTRLVYTANSPPQGQPVSSTNQDTSQGFGWARSARKIFPIMGQCYSFHFRIFENKGGKKCFFPDEKKKKKKKVLDFIPRGFPCGNFFTIWLPPIRTPARVFRIKKLSVLGGEFAIIIDMGNSNILIHCIEKNKLP